MTKLRQICAVFAALILLTSAVGGAAAIAWDTETTNTTTTSDVDGTTTSLDVYHGNSTKTTHFEVSGASTSNLTLRMSPAADGVDYVAYSNSSADELDATNGHYGWDVSHDELADLPRSVSGGEYDVEIINEDNGNEVLNATTITFNQANSDKKAIMVLTQDTTDNGAAMTHLVADRLEHSEESAGFLASLSGANDTTTATWSGYTTVDGDNTTVDVRMENSTTADAYSSAASDYDDGDWIRESTIFLNGIPHKVYKNEAPSDAEGTTVVYKSSSDKLVVSPSGEHYQDVRTLQMRGAAGQSYGFGELWSNFGYMDALASLSPF